MSTDRQIAANRRNAQKSTGPRTDSGKAASSGNARRHGLTGELNKDAVLCWYRVILEDDTADPDPFERDAYFRAAANLARAEAHLQRVRAAEENLLLHPEAVPTCAEDDLQEIRRCILKGAEDYGWDRKLLSLWGRTEKMLERERLRKQMAGEAAARALMRYRASAEARRRVALRLWNDEITKRSQLQMEGT